MGPDVITQTREKTLSAPGPICRRGPASSGVLSMRWVQRLTGIIQRRCDCSGAGVSRPGGRYSLTPYCCLGDTPILLESPALSAMEAGCPRDSATDGPTGAKQQSLQHVGGQYYRVWSMARLSHCPGRQVQGRNAKPERREPRFGFKLL